MRKMFDAGEVAIESVEEMVELGVATGKVLMDGLMSETSPTFFSGTTTNSPTTAIRIYRMPLRENRASSTDRPVHRSSATRA